MLDPLTPSLAGGFFELRTLPLAICLGLRTVNLWGVWRRARHLLAEQGRLGRREMRLAYLIVFPEHRSHGYGRSTVHLLINAFLRNTTNDVLVERITLFVREGNRVARRLFGGCGFVPARLDPQGGAHDPLAAATDVGRILFMQRTRDPRALAGRS